MRHYLTGFAIDALQLLNEMNVTLRSQTLDKSVLAAAPDTNRQRVSGRDGGVGNGRRVEAGGIDSRIGIARGVVHDDLVEERLIRNRGERPIELAGPNGARFLRALNQCYAIAE